MTAAEYKASHSLTAFIESQGRQINTSGKEPVCCCFFHDDKHPSMKVYANDAKYKCFSCGANGDIFDLMAHIQGRDPKELVKELCAEPERPKAKKNTRPHVARTITYKYLDAVRQERFRVDRVEYTDGTKDFYPHQIINGERVNNITGVERVLYRLPDIGAEDEVYLCEGEKCVHALVAAGFPATTNSGGSNGWLDGYAESLRGVHVVIMPDNDEAGEKWLAAVLKSLAGKVATTAVVRMPAEYNDVADMVIADGEEKAASIIRGLLEKTMRISRGIDLPIYSSAEVMDRYRAMITRDDHNSVDLGLWLPSLKPPDCRPLGPGDMFLFQADTGVGKTAALQNIAVSQKHLAVLMFEIELDDAFMGERFTAMTTKTKAWEVERRTREGHRFDDSGWSHIWTCAEPHVTVEKMEELTNAAELKIGRKPGLVLIDYIGLIGGVQGKRYERMSTIAEQVKVMGRSTGAVIGIASQIRRKPEGEKMSLHDAKDSGSIEASSQCVLGAWKTAKDKMTVKLLKRTSGFAGREIECKFDGPTLLIRELQPTPEDWQP